MKTNFKKLNIVLLALMIVFIYSNLYAEVKIINSNKENFRLTIRDDPYQKEYEAAKVVQSFLTSYFVKRKNIWSCDEIFPQSKILYNIANYWDWECDPLHNSGEYQFLYIDDVKIEKQVATVCIYEYWNLIEHNNEYWVSLEEVSKEEPNMFHIKLGLINGKWYIIEIGNTHNFLKDELEKDGHTLGFARAIDKNNKIYLYDKPTINSSIIGEIVSDSIELKLEKTSSKDFFRCYDLYSYSCNADLLKWKNENYDLENCYIKSSDVSTSLKINQGSNKEVAYLLFGYPVEKKETFDGTILYYSKQDYIKYDKNNRIISWNGFDDFKSFFEEGKIDAAGIVRGRIISKSGLNLREAPSTQTKKVGGLAYDTKVIVLDKSNNIDTFENITSNWYKVTDGKVTGWGFGGFIEIIDK